MNRENKKLIRKQLGEDQLIINIQSKSPETLVIKIVDVEKNRVLLKRKFIPKKRNEKLVINLPYRDYVLSVDVKTLNGEAVSHTAHLKTDKFYLAATGHNPMTTFAQAQASGVSGGGNVASQQEDGTFRIISDSQYCSDGQDNVTLVTYISAGITSITLQYYNGSEWQDVVTAPVSQGFYNYSISLNTGTSPMPLNIRLIDTDNPAVTTAVYPIVFIPCAIVSTITLSSIDVDGDDESVTVDFLNVYSASEMSSVNLQVSNDDSIWSNQLAMSILSSPMTIEDYVLSVPADTFINSLYYRVQGKNSQGQFIYSNSLQYILTSVELNGITAGGDFSADYVNAYETTTGLYLLIQTSVNDLDWSDLGEYPVLPSNPYTKSYTVLITVPTDGLYYRIGVKDVDGDMVYSNSLLYSVTSVVFNSINVLGEIDADFVNAYVNTGGGMNNIIQVYDLVSPDEWVYVATFELPSSPYTGNLNTLADNLIPYLVNGKLYRIWCLDYANAPVYSNSLLYTSPSSVILNSIDGAGNVDADYVDAYEVDASGVQLQYQDGEFWLVQNSMVLPSNPYTGNDIAVLGFTPVHERVYRIYILDVNGNPVYSDEYTYLEEGYISVFNDDEIIVVDYPLLATTSTVQIYNNSALEEVRFPAMLINTNYIYIYDNPLLNTLELPLFNDAVSIQISNNDSLPSIDLPALTVIASVAELNDNALVTSVDLSALAIVGGTLRLNNNPSLNDLRTSSLASVGTLEIIVSSLAAIDLSALTDSASSIAIGYNSVLTAINLSALANAYNLSIYAVFIPSLNLPLVTSLNELNVYSNSLLTDIETPSLSLCGACNIYSNPVLTNLDIGALLNATIINIYDNDALPTINLPLLMVTSTLVIYSNPLLTTINLASVSSAAGTMYIYVNASLTALDLSALASASDLQIYLNPVLTEILLPALTASATQISISQNDLLDTIDLSALTSATAIYISNNADLASVLFTNLVTTTGQLYIGSNSSLANIDFSALTSVYGLLLDTNASYLSLDLSSVTTLGNSIWAADNNLLTEMLIPNLVTGAGRNIYSDRNNSITTIDLSSIVSLSYLRVDACPLFTTLIVPSLTAVSYFSFNNNDSMVSLDLSLVTAMSGYSQITGNALLATLDLSALQTVGASLNINQNASLVSIDLSSLTSCPTELRIESNNDSLVSVDISSLVTVGNLYIRSSEVLADIIISNALSSLNIDFSRNALTELSVDTILDKLDVAGYSNGTLDLSGGTNATPSAGGLASKANLVGRGWTVTNN